MDFQKLQRKYRSAKMGRMVLSLVSIILLLSNLLLVFKIYNTSNQIVLIPTSITDGMVARGATDKRYIEAIALDAVYGLYNASPATLAYGREIIERVSSTRNRNQLLKRYDEISNDIRERDISTVFQPRQIEHNFDKLEVIIEGDLKTYLNTVRVSIEPRRIKLNFVVEAGSVRLSGINLLEFAK
jgi:conjugal transfer pilus assembly protein TraE